MHCVGIGLPRDAAAAPHRQLVPATIAKLGGHRFRRLRFSPVHPGTRHEPGVWVGRVRVLFCG